ncbi:MAG TPA: hypothetical protein VG944_08600 [Fimbriimonas sp.]|nr:hypothetical protein [Fimbriimonas sp.]
MNPGIIALFIPIIIFMIPIVAILAWHQQRMAVIVHGERGAAGELEALRKEVFELRQLINQQALMLDSVNSAVRSLPRQTYEPQKIER